MGIEGLWKLIEGTAIRRPLSEFVEDEGIRANNCPRGLRVGVDASIWFRQIQQPFHIGHAQSGENPELRTIFRRLARYSSMAINLVIIFDGPGRPSLKRSTRVVPQAHFLTDGFKCLAEAFGFVTYMAPGEAEAELAHLNKLGIIDAVLTDDSDALIFGAKVIIRNPTVKTDHDYITLYSQAALMGGDLNLSPERLLLFAILKGGDYSQGLLGCGVSLAFRLTRYVDLADALYSAVTRPTDVNLRMELLAWRARLCDCLRYDPDGYLGRRYPTLSGSIPLSFPDVTVIRAYTCPLVSATPPYPALGFDTQPPRVHVGKLAQLCEVYFGFGTPYGIVTTFEKNVWQGVLLRDIICRIVSGGDIDVMRSVLADYSIIDGNRQEDRPHYARARIQFRPRTYIHQILSSLRSLPNRIDNRDDINIDIVYNIQLPFTLVRYLDQHLPTVLPAGTALPRPPSVTSEVEVEDILSRSDFTAFDGTTSLSHVSLPSRSPSWSPPPWVSRPAVVLSQLDIIDLTGDSDEDEAVIQVAGTSAVTKSPSSTYD